MTDTLCSSPTPAPVDNFLTAAKISEHLIHRAALGCRYFRAKEIAADLHLTSHEVGYYLWYLAKTSTDFEIIQWGCSKSVSWKITLRGR
ncbi:DUF7123 family protein [Methanorbis furvi]|uniref:DUF7123 family protein n=1 Tax=Methanorbis furvi TaxID=3028299 RepID=UPI0030B8D868